MNANSDHDETRSKHSVGSSTCYSNSNNNNTRRRHKRPNRKRPRAKDEPVYNNVAVVTQRHESDEESAEDNYLGDDDHFDDATLERRTNKSRLSVPASSSDQINEPLIASEDDSKDGLSSSQQVINEFTAADLLKRETSV